MDKPNPKRQFEKGQRVVALQDMPEIKKGEIYPVIDTFMCCEQSIDVGLILPEGVVKIYCTECRDTLPLSSYWRKSQYFAPVTEVDEFILEAMDIVPEHIYIKPKERKPELV